MVVAAAIATLKKLKRLKSEIYSKLEDLGQHMETGLHDLLNSLDCPSTVVRQGSAFVVYFMDHPPISWRDISMHNNTELDIKYRNKLIENGIFHFPVTTKQGSISYAHTLEDINETLEITEKVLFRIN